MFIRKTPGWTLFALAFGAIALSAITFGISRPVLGANELTIAGVQGFSEDEAGTVILKEAYRRIGIKIIIRRFPAKRALITANEGKYDGDLQRIDAVKDLYKNLIQVRPAINYFEASVFSARHDFEVKGWESLRPYRIGIIRGMKFAEANTKGMNRIETSSYEALLKMLDSGRVDVGILPRVNGLFQRIKWATQNVHELRPALFRIDLYHYVHRKNIDLVPRLSAAIRNMQEQGELATMREEANAILLKSATTASGGGENK